MIIRYAILLAATLAVACHGPAAEIDFAHEIVPILRSHCATCHGGREEEGGFSINDRESWIESGLVSVGEPSHSEVLDRIVSADADTQMPPPDRARLSQKQISLVRDWIEQGLPWEPGFSFEVRSYEPPLRPRPVALPSVTDGREHPIDRLLDQYLVERGLALPDPIDDATFLRRVSLDLVGLLPNRQELADFLGDPSPDKRSRLIDDLLARELDYADHWLSFFNDLFRNDYSGTGFITGGRRQISKWLYSALKQNLPFDRMARELVSPATIESRGFIDGIKWRGEVSAGQTLPIQFAQSVSQAFLGINLKCASCHDSFVDRWTLKEAYGLAAIYADQPLALHRCDKPTGEVQSAAWLFPELGQLDATLARDQRLERLAELMTDSQNGRFARTIVNRLWHRMMGRGLVHPLDAMQTEPWHAELLEHLANQLVASDYDLKGVLRWIATSEAYQSRCEIRDEEAGEYVYRGPRARRMTAEQFMDAVWQLTGTAPTEFDAPAFRSSATREEIEAAEIAGRWIWAPCDGPPPAGEELLLRKIVQLETEVENAGAVITCDNEFTLFVGGREVASSRDWTRPQLVNLKGHLKKGTNVLLLRVRNAGETPNAAGAFLQARVVVKGGHVTAINSDASWEYSRGVPKAREGRQPAPAKGWEAVVEVPELSVWRASLDKSAKALIAQTERLEMEQPMVRASLIKNTPLMQSLGRPLREQIVSMRPDQLTTLEAIDLANNATLTESLRRGARVWLAREFASTDDMLTAMFQAALTREPTATERRLFRETLGDEPTEEAVQDALWVLLMLPEFLLVR
ncbi:MAG: DUF1549 domain-containing protein [Planctomycetota bacterium]